MTFRAWALLGALSLFLVSTGTPLTADNQSDTAPLDHKPLFRALAPGEFVVHKQQIPVDIVLIGFGEDQVNQADLLGLLPATYKPVVRYPRFYGLDGRNMGLEYTFEYSVTQTKRPFDDQFFKYLASIGNPIARTIYQTAYNNQASNVLDVT